MKKFKEWIKIKEANDDLNLDMDIDMDLEPAKPNTAIAQPRASITQANKPSIQSKPQSQPTKKPSGIIQLGKGTNFKFLEGKYEDEFISGSGRSSGLKNLELYFETKDPSFKQLMGTRNHPVAVTLLSLDGQIKKGLFGSVKKFGELPAKMDVGNNSGLRFSRPEEGSVVVRIRDIKINIADKELSPRIDFLQKLVSGNGVAIESRSFQNHTISVKM